MLDWDVHLWFSTVGAHAIHCTFNGWYTLFLVLLINPVQ